MSRKLFPRPCVRAVATFAVLLPLLSQLHAQTTAVAEVSGIVSDATGKSIAGAEITVTQTEKQLVNTTTSNEEGRYLLPNLPIGPYRLEVKAPGFKNYTQTGIDLQVGNNVQINIPMEIGSLSEHVEVSATVSMVETKE